MKVFDWTLTILVLVALPAFGREKAQATANTLTAAEISEGWILLFDGETTFGWKIDGDAAVKDGVLILGGNKATKAASTTSFDWGNPAYDLDMEVRWEGEKPPTILLVSVRVPLNEDCKGNFIRASHKSLPYGRGLRPTEPQSFEVPAGSKLLLRNIKYRPHFLKPIFNGKDLSGWKEVKTARTKSTFSVTKEGWLNVKKGPGDLETEGQWDDFILQLECISNGKHLNSGVFFRCIPGQYLRGYEAQIQNQWAGNDRTRPVDYGTGAIYNRQPARRVVSNDYEWFTMTIIAQGKHLAVWVNGYQTADFTDNRPVGMNPRQNCKVAKGTISLQGHDPTTDLSFRNIRIVELPGKDDRK